MNLYHFKRLGELSPQEWKDTKKQWEKEWKSIVQMYKGKRFCSHNIGEPPSSLKDELPPNGLHCTIRFPNGVTKEDAVEYHSDDLRTRRNTLVIVQQCAKCGALFFERVLNIGADHRDEDKRGIV